MFCQIILENAAVERRIRQYMKVESQKTGNMIYNARWAHDVQPTQSIRSIRNILWIFNADMLSVSLRKILDVFKEQ